MWSGFEITGRWEDADLLAARIRWKWYLSLWMFRRGVTVDRMLTFEIFWWPPDAVRGSALGGAVGYFFATGIE